MGINAIALDLASNENGTRSSETGIAEVRKLNPRTSSSAQGSVLLLDRRTLDRDCLARSLEANDPELRIMAFANLEEWNDADLDAPSAVVFVLGGVSPIDSNNYEMIREITRALPDTPLVVIAETDEIGQMLKAVEHGAHGYIPSSVGVGVAVEAIRLARAGGVFLPASGILAVQSFVERAIKNSFGPENLFTPREAQVAEALRRGKANKIIAYELNLRESTVKVHIRNIMKKLNATNRTEVAYKLSEML